MPPRHNFLVPEKRPVHVFSYHLPNGKSWRFVPRDFVFPNPANPFQSPFPEYIEVASTTDPLPDYFQFVGIKIGDVNLSANPGQ